MSKRQFISLDERSDAPPKKQQRKNAEHTTNMNTTKNDVNLPVAYTMSVFSNMEDNTQCSLIYNTLESIASRILDNNAIIPSDILKIIAFDASGHIRICNECETTEIFLINDQRYIDSNDVFFHYNNKTPMNINKKKHKYDFIFCKECIVYNPTINCSKCNDTYPIALNVEQAYKDFINLTQQYKQRKRKNKDYFLFVENLLERYDPQVDNSDSHLMIKLVTLTATTRIETTRTKLLIIKLTSKKQSLRKQQPR